MISHGKRYSFDRLYLSRLAGAEGALPGPVAEEAFIVDAAALVVLVELAFFRYLILSHARVTVNIH